MKTAVIILAAGKGTRMKSEKVKVLHEIGGKSLLYYVLEASRKLEVDKTIIVVGHQANT
ncbi:MAG: N-acetylglucosamine-1-phosphate uridyltransferase, partial [Deltaproteobacteria bacterium]|nr:N-acetylglucosamine-1-phosphate uridyltransferase [Deltaproteobacteria bacterium]